MGSSSEEKDQSQGAESSTISERLVAFLGAVAIVAIAGFMLWQAIQGEDSPPNVEIEIMHIKPSGDDYLVQIIAVNHGSNTAAGATVKGELLKNGKPIETSTVTIDYVPSQSRVQAGLYFSQRPTRETLRLSVGGYYRP